MRAAVLRLELALQSTQKLALISMLGNCSSLSEPHKSLSLSRSLSPRTNTTCEPECYPSTQPCRPQASAHVRHRARFQSRWFRAPSCFACHFHLPSYEKDSDWDGIRRHFSTCEPRQTIRRQSLEFSRIELLDLVDIYDTCAVTPIAAEPSHSSIGSAEREIEIGHGTRATTHYGLYRPHESPHKIHGGIIQQLEGLLQEEETPPDELYHLYMALPSPRASFLTKRAIRSLLRHLMIVERKDELSRARYMSVIDDLKQSAIPIRSPEWNSSISFAGHSRGTVTVAEIQSAIQLMYEMDASKNAKPTNATFGILMDIASKGGKFKLVDALQRQMEERGLPLTRYIRCVRIYSAGLMGDGDGVRRAYRNCVESGEIIDTVVLNCVIAALLRAGEPTAAESVFGRMKVLQLTRSLNNEKQESWRESRKSGQMLDKMSQIFRGNPQMLRQLQENTLISPNKRSYALLIRYHCNISGNIDRVTDLLDEMEYMQIPIYGPIFYSLFRGFGIHGGVPYSSWTGQRLGFVWRAFLKAVDLKVNGVYFTPKLLATVMRAFRRLGGRESAAQAWKDANMRWRPHPEDADQIMSVLRSPSTHERGRSLSNDWHLL